MLSLALVVKMSDGQPKPHSSRTERNIVSRIIGTFFVTK